MRLKKPKETKKSFQSLIGTLKTVCHYSVFKVHNRVSIPNRDAKNAKQAWLLAKAMETKAVDRLEQLQGQRDTLKALVKSHHTSW